tara:strand:- start:337 stop:1533 length:1197 start_codon:yes stop_codon:yes gene_type:complete
MKRLSFSFLIVIVLSFIMVHSCSSEEDDTIAPNVIQTAEEESNPVQYTLTVSASEGGTVSTEGGTFDEGTEVTFTATPDEGFKFIGWEGNDSTSESLTVTINSDKTIQALFELIPSVQYNLNISASVGGTVSTEGGTYDEGTEVNITATPNEGYLFVGWDGIEDTSNEITVLISSNTTVVAIFQVIAQFTVTISASEGGTVSSIGGTFIEGEELSVEASPNTGYEFVRWEEVDISTSSLTISVSSSISLTAIFSALPNESNSSNPTDEDEGPVLWRGATISFNKPDGTNPNLEENQDRIRENVRITRGNSGGQIFNIAINSNANKIESPVGTEWAIGTLDEIDNLSFDYFRNAITRPKNVVGKNLVLHLIEEDIYLTVKFISWSQGKRGGFSYERSSP